MRSSQFALSRAIAIKERMESRLTFSDLFFFRGAWPDGILGRMGVMTPMTSNQMLEALPGFHLRECVPIQDDSESVEIRNVGIPLEQSQWTECHSFPSR